MLVHNSYNHGCEWAAERRSHWRNEGARYFGKANPDQFSASGTYKLTQKNIDLMMKGKAPFGVDGMKVQLHHTVGITNDFYSYIEITFTEHFAKFVELHPWLF